MNITNKRNTKLSIVIYISIIILFLWIAFISFELHHLNKVINELLNEFKGNPNQHWWFLNNSNSDDLSLIFTFIGVIFGLFSFLTYQGVKDFYEAKIEFINQKMIENDKILKDYQINMKDLESKLIKLNNDNSFINAQIMYDLAIKYKDIDFNNYVILSLQAAKFYARNLHNPIDENGTFIQSTKSQIRNILYILSVKIKNKINYTNTELASETIKTIKEDILKINDFECNEYLKIVLEKIEIDGNNVN